LQLVTLAYEQGYDLERLKLEQVSKFFLYCPSHCN
jgi:hypothetical protein